MGYRKAFYHAITFLSLAACSSSSSTNSSYSLGGLVSGLNGIVVLSDGNEKLSISKNGPFTFTQHFAAQQDYQVTVLVQPDGQVCSLAEAVGTVVNQNVSTVQVSCSTAGATTGSTSGTTTSSTTGGTTSGTSSGTTGGTSGTTTGGITGHHVGGSIFGLQGSITIQNAAQGAITESLTVSSNGTFSFTDALAFGVSYSVTIVGQPTGQTCTLQNGTNVMGTSDIKNVAVQCMYSLGGALNGITGGTLNIQNISGDGNNANLELTMNGAFVFSPIYNTNTTYTVSVVSQPAGQTCVVSPNAGIIGIGNVTNLSVSCGPAAYPIGGTITGLANDAQVVLQDNVLVTASIGQNGNFVVDSGASGFTYNVAIQEQPAGQTCALTGGVGTVSNQPITSLSIACANNAVNTYSVGGSVSGLQAESSITLGNGSDTLTTSNGNFTISPAVALSASYSVQVTAQATAQQCTVINGSGTITGSAVNNVVVTCVPFIRLVNGQSAAVEFGQVDFTASAGDQGGACGANTSDVPFGAGFSDPNGWLYLVDGYNNRILVFTELPTTNNSDASYVIGQSNFTSCGDGTAESSYWLPDSLAINGNNGFLLSDWVNNRVLIFSGFYSAVGNTPSVVLGQMDTTSSSSGCSATALNSPNGSVVIGSRLFVADAGNSRVLIWNTFPTQDGASADLVLGQTSLTTCSQNQGLGPTANSLNTPRSVWSDGIALYVSDTQNNRILVWADANNITANGSSADYVIGQFNMTSNAPATSATGLNNPWTMGSDGTQLFVTDQYNNRIVIYPNAPTSNGMAATGVLGSSSLTSATACPNNSTLASASTMCQPQGITVAGNTLIVADTGNNRYLFFNSN